MTFLKGNRSDPFVFDYDETKDLGSELHARYAAADPFPHIVIDNFLPQEVADYCLSHFPRQLDPDGQEFDRDQERFKRSYQPDFLEPKLRNLFYAFNSRPFIRIIENISGIKGLIPDPFFLGGGFHEIRNGGHLSMHADFNHHKPMNLERRINLLVYLNRDWKPDYGGQLELWRTDMSEKVQDIVPLFNRAAMFTTTEQSMHGNPQPVAHPEGVTRKSIALYYYTSTWSHIRESKTTQFRQRPGTADRKDWEVAIDRGITELLPPLVSRRVMALKHRLKRRG
jgi:Rps23 Pro-64 3,4-dihydroxylase Tpa1-like proline 4-hydroxylase